MDNWTRDLQYAFRALAKKPGFAAVAVLSLAIGIGATVNIFSFVDTYLLRPLPYEEPDQLAHIWSTTRQSTSSRVSVPDFLDWRSQTQIFEDLAAYNYTMEALTGGEFPEQISGGKVSANTFELLGVSPMLGRGFLEGEDRTGNDDVALISESFWRERYASDPDVLGRTLHINNRLYTIIGVMAQGFHFPIPTTEVWIPRLLDDPTLGRGRSVVQVVGRLRSGSTLEQAQAEMDRITARLEQEYPEENEGRGARIEPLREALNFADEVMRPMSVLLLAAVGFILIIACSNVSNLLLSRAVAREREIAVRSALGAGRGRLIRQLLTESAVLALLGGTMGTALAAVGVASIRAAIPNDIYRVGEMTIDAKALVFVLLVSLLSSILFGLLPALRASRTALSETLKEANPGSGRKLGLHGLMVGVEMCLGIVLLIGTTLMIRTLMNLQHVDPGFRKDGVMTLRMTLPPSRYDAEARIARFHAALIERAKAIPGVVEASTVNFLPLNHETFSREFTIEGREIPETPWAAISFTVSPGYFEVMGIPHLRGRLFDEQDGASSPRVAVIDQTMSERFWTDSNPIGARFLLSDREQLVTIIGVVGNSKQVDLTEERRPYIYLLQEQFPGRYLRLLAQTDGDPTEYANTLRAAIKDVDPLLPVTEVRSIGEVFETFLLPQYMMVNILGIIAVGALLLAVTGTYGLMAFFVSQQIRNIGIRVALGATVRDVRLMIVRRVLKLAGVGIGVGIAASFGLMRLMSSLLYGVTAADPASFLGAALFLASVAVAAGLIGARRATSMDPTLALHYE